MKRAKHKRKEKRILLVTSNAVDAQLAQYKLHPRFMYVLVLLLCAVIGAFIGYAVYEQDVLTQKEAEALKQQQTIALLEQEKAQLEAEIVVLNDTVQILSDTVNMKTQNENELTQLLDEQTQPTEFPLTGAASMEEATEGEPMCIFTATTGALVVSTASGTVIAVNDDGEYGHNVWIDHGNGYVTIYRNQGDAKVKQGEEVSRGTTLFLIDEENDKLGYQMMKDGVYINPMDMLVISG